MSFLGENWEITLFISILITWGIGLAPPLLIRYVFFKRPIKNWVAIGVVFVFFFLNVILFTALGSENKTHTALLFVSVISYGILRKSNKSIASTPEAGGLISARKYAKKYGASEQKVIELLEAGDLTGVQKSGEWFVMEADLERL